MRIPVEYRVGKFVTVELDDDLLGLVSSAPSFPTSIAAAFSLSSRVPDVWRYTFQVQKSEIVTPLVPVPHPSIISNFSDRPAADAVGSSIILITLTSPHKDEFRKDLDGAPLPKAPAQSRARLGAGKALQSYGHLVLNQLNLRDGEYSLLLANPVPYQCSLSSVCPGRPAPLSPDLRNHVWRKLFELEFVQEDFLKRCRLYAPEVVLNCCVPVLQTELTTFLCDHYLIGNEAKTLFFESVHPSVNWSTLEKTGIPVYRFNIHNRNRKLL